METSHGVTLCHIFQVGSSPALRGLVSRPPPPPGSLPRRPASALPRTAVIFDGEQDSDCAKDRRFH